MWRPSGVTASTRDRAVVSPDHGEFEQIIDPVGQDLMRAEKKGPIDSFPGIRQGFEPEQYFRGLIFRILLRRLDQRTRFRDLRPPQISSLFVRLGIGMPCSPAEIIDGDHACDDGDHGDRAGGHRRPEQAPRVPCLGLDLLALGIAFALALTFPFRPLGVARLVALRSGTPWPSRTRHGSAMPMSRLAASCRASRAPVAVPDRATNLHCPPRAARPSRPDGGKCAPTAPRRPPT